MSGKIFYGFFNGYIYVGIDYFRKKNVIEEIYVY